MSMRDLLRARSEAPLEALELGPLIGRGSFGRVYKGEAPRPALRRASALASHACGMRSRMLSPPLHWRSCLQAPPFIPVSLVPGGSSKPG